MPYKAASVAAKTKRKFIFPWIGFDDSSGRNDEQKKKESRKTDCLSKFIIHMSSRFWRMIFYDC